MIRDSLIESRVKELIENREKSKYYGVKFFPKRHRLIKPIFQSVDHNKKTRFCDIEKEREEVRSLDNSNIEIVEFVKATRLE